MDKQLRHPYISVCYGGAPSFGGNQRRAGKKITRQCGCGVVACADLLLYLGANRPGCTPVLPSEASIPAETYNGLLETLRRKYLPLFPRFGLNGLLMVLGLNRWLRRNRWPLRAVWGVRPGRMQRCIGQMLARDLPVILAIGPNLPLFWRRKKLTLYRKTPGGDYKPVGGTCAHYVTVTAMEGEWLHLSSWGEAYSIRWAEYQAYVKQYSSYFASNIVYLRPTRFSLLKGRKKQASR